MRFTDVVFVLLINCTFNEFNKIIRFIYIYIYMTGKGNFFKFELFRNEKNFNIIIFHTPKYAREMKGIIKNNLMFIKHRKPFLLSLD